MKKNLLYILSAGLFSFSAFGQANFNQDAIVKQITSYIETKVLVTEPSQKLELEWNTGTSAFDSSEVSDYTYNGNGLLMEEFTREYDTSGVWKNFQKTNFFYTVNQMDSGYFYSWAGGVWALSLKYYFTYTPSGKMKTLSLVYNAGGTWISYINITNYYDGNDFSSGAFSSVMGAPSDSTTYTVDGTGNILTETSLKYESGAWVNNEFETNTYDGNNNKTQKITQEWNTLSSAYVNFSKENWTFNASNNETNYIRQNWNGSAFTDNSKTDSYYDGSGDLTYDLSQKFDGTNWVNNVKNVYNAGVTFPVAIVEASQSAHFVLSPNPTSGKFSILSSNTFNTVEIYNVLGEKVYQQIDNSDQPIDLSFQPKGIYFVQIKDGEKNFIQKLIVE